MARDAQLGGDRVQAEYYLQFADHYFRMLGDNRPRSDDQRQQRDDSDDDDGDEDIAESADDSDRSNGRDEQHQRPERKERSARPDRGDRPDRGERPRRYQRDDRNDDDSQDRVNGNVRAAGNGESIPLDVLPPAISRDASLNESDADEEAPRPKRRARRTPPAGDGEPASLV